MEKKGFLLVIPLGIICFICFGVSVLVMGTKPIEYTSESIVQSDTENDFNYENDNYYSKVSTWEFEGTDRLSINLSGMNADIKTYDGDKIKVTVDSKGDRSLFVKLSATKTDSHIEVHPSNVTFGVIQVGLTNWIDDIFSGGLERRVTIELPSRVYEKITYKQGSGNVTINDLCAKTLDVTLGSGDLKFQKDEKIVSDNVIIDLGSGNSRFTGLSASSYDIDCGSGDHEIENLTGAGKIDIGSGHLKITYGKQGVIGYTNASVGSGHFDVYIPENTDLTIKPVVGSGSITVDTNAIKAVLDRHHTKEITLGDKGPEYAIILGSGQATIKNSA